MAGLLSSTMYFSLWMDKSLWAYLSLHGNLPACPQYKHMYSGRPPFPPGVSDKYPVGLSTGTANNSPLGEVFSLYTAWIADLPWEAGKQGRCYSEAKALANSFTFWVYISGSNSQGSGDLKKQNTFKVLS